MANFRITDQQFGPTGADRSVFEVPMIANKNGLVVTPENPFPVTVSSSATSTGSDAFGRTRISQPFTLFDSSHRYADNGLFSEATTGTANTEFQPAAGLINMNVGTSSGDEVIRETNKVFSYQPGKSLLIMTSFYFEPAKTNLRQRVGYFGAQNGIYLQLNDSSLSIVERSYVTGGLTESVIPQSSWSYDKLDGTGPSGITLDITKAQIMWMDVEWLGLGNVRTGFVINGSFIVAHVFQHANIVTGTYITTASLPLRQELTNTGVTSSNSTCKQICSTVISEGGYELRGRQHAISIPITSAYSLTTAGTYYPVVSIRLKSARQDAIVILTALSLLGVGNGVNFAWRLQAGGTVTTSWTSAGSDSAVEYSITGSAHDGGGRTLASGYINSSNQGSPTVDILKEALFKFQLERNGLTGTSEPLALLVAAATDSEEIFASLDWEEITR